MLPNAASEPLPRDLSLAKLMPCFRDAALEAQFRRDHVVASVQPFARRALPIGAVLFAAYAVADALVLPDPTIAIVPRFAVGCVMVMVASALAFTPIFRAANQAILLLFGLGPALGSLLIAARAPAEASILYSGWIAIFVSCAPLVARYTVPMQLVYVALSTALLVALEGPRADVSPGVLRGLVWTTISMGLFGALLAWLDERHLRQTYALRRTVEAQAIDLAKERARSETLLLNMLPPSVAARLKDNQGLIADGYAEATVLFADIVGFTQLSATLTPEALLLRLNEVFTGFDTHCAALGLEKIKTIGDAYMVVASVPEPMPDHAVRSVQMALRMLHTLAELRAKHGDGLDVRIGIHTGPIVAGVIGTRKFAYDVWGDTVNTASRMESHGKPGRIQLSDVTARLVEDQFDLEDRGLIDVKGKGALRTFFVRGARDSASSR